MTSSQLHRGKAVSVHCSRSLTHSLTLSLAICLEAPISLTLSMCLEMVEGPITSEETHMCTWAHHTHTHTHTHHTDRAGFKSCSPGPLCTDLLLLTLTRPHGVCCSPPSHPLPGTGAQEAGVHGQDDRGGHLRGGEALPEGPPGGPQPADHRLHRRAAPEGTGVGPDAGTAFGARRCHNWLGMRHVCSVRFRGVSNLSTTGLSGESKKRHHFFLQLLFF